VDGFGVVVGLVEAAVGLRLAVLGVRRMKPEDVSRRAAASDAYHRQLDGSSRSVAYYERRTRSIAIITLTVGVVFTLSALVLLFLALFN